MVRSFFISFVRVELALGDKFFVCWDPDLVPSTVAEVLFLSFHCFDILAFRSHMTIRLSRNEPVVKLLEQIWPIILQLTTSTTFFISRPIVLKT